jgi:hypothetical protein
MSWTTASLRALAIFVYFVVATVVVPDVVIGLGPIAEASNFVRDAVTLGVWGAGLVVGLWLLRRLQARNLI